MSNEERRKRWLLAALAVAAGILLWRQLGPYLSSFGTGSGDGATRAGAVSRGGALSTLPEVVDLRLEDLEKVPGQFSSERDPFRFGVDPKPAPPPVTDSESAMRRAMREARNEEQQEARRTPAAPKPPPVDVEYLGSFGPRNRKLAVFSNGSEIFNVFEGDRLNENFYLVKIGLESADIGFVDFPDAPAQRLQVGG